MGLTNSNLSEEIFDNIGKTIKLAKYQFKVVIKKPLNNQKPPQDF